jgi:predicted metal-dependent phosphoesterase TrpH
MPGPSDLTPASDLPRQDAPPLGTVLDSHIHTVRGAADSELQPDDLLSEARRHRLTGLNVSEHDRSWDRHDWARFRDQAGPDLFLSQGMEVSTDLGHVIVFGIDQYYQGIRSCERLREIADEIGAFISVAHPFRHFFDPTTFTRRGQEPFSMTPAQAADRMRVFQVVHGIEVCNGANTQRENSFAYRVATILGTPMTAGSDAHSTSGIGACVTVFPEPLHSTQQMLGHLHAGRTVPYLGGEGGVRGFVPDDNPPAS